MAALGSIGSVSVEIRADLESLNADLKKIPNDIGASFEGLKSLLSGIGQGLADRFENAKRAANEIGASFQGLKGLLSGVGQGLADRFENVKRIAKDIKTSLGEFGEKLSSTGNKIKEGISNPLLKFGRDAIKAAGDVEQMQSKFNTVFGEAASDVEQWANTQAGALNRSRFDLQGYLATLQGTFEPLGFASNQATEMSKQVTLLAEDLASFSNQETGDVLKNLTSVITRNVDAVREFGVAITQDRLSQKLKDMGVAGVAAATDQEKAFARLQLVLEDTSDAQGTALKTSGSFNSQMRGLQSAFGDLSVEIGQILLPFAKQFIEWLRDAVEWFKNLDPAIKQIGVVVAAVFAVGGPALVAVGAFVTAVAAVGTVGGVVLVAIAAAVAAFVLFEDEVIGAFQGLTDFVAKAVDFVGEKLDAIVGFAQAVAEGLKTWLVDKAKGIFETLTLNVDKVISTFRGMWDKVAGNSFVPDMIDAIAENFARLPSVMVEPAIEATESVSNAFEEVGNIVEDNLTSALQSNIETWQDLKEAALDAIQNIILDLLKLVSVQSSLAGFFSGLFGTGTTTATVGGSTSLGAGISPTGSDIAGTPFAPGGLVRGPGTGTSDSILARLSDGEFVVNARATSDNLPLLRALNAGSPAFQAGGLVLPSLSGLSPGQLIDTPSGNALGSSGLVVNFNGPTDGNTVRASLPQLRRAGRAFLVAGGSR
jgi:hypothetical protein